MNHLQCRRHGRCRSDIRLHSIAATPTVLAAASTVCSSTSSDTAEPSSISDRRHMPLHAAVFEGDVSMTAELLARGVLVNAPTDDGETPLHLAATNGHVALITLLCDHSAAVDVQDQHGDSPLHKAARHAAATSALLMHGAQPTQRNHLGDGALHASAYLGSTQCLRVLVDHRADADAAGHGGERPLGIAARHGHLEAVRFLIERVGAAVDATDSTGARAVHLAAEVHGPRGVVECLLFHKAQPDERLAACLERSARAREVQRAAEQAATKLSLALSPEWVERCRRMPPIVRRLLVYGEDPAGVDAVGLLHEQARGAVDTLTKFRGAFVALNRTAEEAVLHVQGALSPAECAALRHAVDHYGQTSIDSVDTLPNHDIGLGAAQLESIIGRDARKRLFALAERFGQQAYPAGTRHAPRAGVRLGGCFARRYCPYHPKLAEEQPLTSFHFDSAALTVNVALSEDDTVSGGKLLGVYGDKVHTIHRHEGEATVHSSSLLHGVSCVRAGVRYSLIML